MIRLLLVEDDNNLSYIVQTGLQDIIGGYEVITACNGKEGLEAWKEHHPDIIISDIDMPVMNGFEMVRLIRETDGDTPILFASALTSPKDVRKGYDIGVNNYVKKPFIPDELDAHLHAILKMKEGTNNTACNYCYNTNMYDPVTPVFPNPPVWNGYDKATARTNNDFRSLALADTMGFADDKVLLTVGGRHQSIKQPWNNYSKSRFSPMVAAVVRPWGDRVALFANYTEGMEPGQVVGVTYANAGDVLGPRVSKQMELGVKFQTGELTHTVSAFQIKRPSFITDPANRLVDDGEQRLRGVEWSVYGKLTQSLSVLGGVAHIKSEQRNTGKDTYGTPGLRARLGLDWNTPLPGLTVGGRVHYTGKQWADSGNRLRVPAWKRLDLTTSYATKIASTPVRFNASVENVTDKKYWIGTFGDGFVMVGAPRTFRVSATVSF